MEGGPGGLVARFSPEKMGARERSFCRSDVCGWFQLDVGVLSSVTDERIIAAGHFALSHAGRTLENPQWSAMNVL